VNALSHQFHADDLLTADELAGRLKAKRSAVYRMSAAGCPALKVGKELRFLWGDVLDWLEERSARNASEPVVPHRRGTRRDTQAMETVFSMRTRAASGALPEGRPW
jgi:predicted DNA-binding transcriptional regulator AlpA